MPLIYTNSIIAIYYFYKFQAVLIIKFQNQLSIALRMNRISALALIYISIHYDVDICHIIACTFFCLHAQVVFPSHTKKTARINTDIFRASSAMLQDHSHFF